MTDDTIPTAAGYLADLSRRVAALAETQADAIAAAAAACAEACRGDRLIYLLGTGHSHMMAEEGHYRAGGLACVVPVLAAPLMLHEGAMAGTRFERMEGVAPIILDRYPIGPGDILFVFSNSGVNALPVEAARIGRDRGATVIAVTSQNYSRMAANGRPRIADLADIAIDNGAPPGDAICDLGDGLRAGPVSTSIGAAILNAVLVEAVARLQRQGAEAPVYVSANMPGAAERNARLVARYRGRNPHL